jgi:hypothetical protein
LRCRGQTRLETLARTRPRRGRSTDIRPFPTQCQHVVIWNISTEARKEHSTRCNTLEPEQRPERNIQHRGPKGTFRTEARMEHSARGPKGTFNIIEPVMGPFRVIVQTTLLQDDVFKCPGSRPL